jgi:hypothetical protein
MTNSAACPRVLAVSLRHGHHFSKTPSLSIRLLTGLGVAGDAHMGETVKHRSRVRKDPTAPNLRQVHLMHAELFDELRAKGFDVKPGDLGVTGLRNPCIQIDTFQKGLMAATLDKDDAGNLIRKAGIMTIVLADGDVRSGDAIRIELPVGPQRPLQPV